MDSLTAVSGRPTIVVLTVLSSSSAISTLHGIASMPVNTTLEMDARTGSTSMRPASNPSRGRVGPLLVINRRGLRQPILHRLAKHLSDSVLFENDFIDTGPA